MLSRKIAARHRSHGSPASRHGSPRNQDVALTTSDDQQSPKIISNNLSQSQRILKHLKEISSSVQLSQIGGSQISKNRSLSHGSVAPPCPTPSSRVEAATAALAPNGPRRILLMQCAVNAAIVCTRFSGRSGQLAEAGRSQLDLGESFE